MYSLRSQHFTIMELLVVMALMALAVSFSLAAVGNHRNGRPAFVKETSAFREFMATARRQAMMTSHGIAIVQDEEKLPGEFGLVVKILDEKGEYKEDELYPLRWAPSEDFVSNIEHINEHEEQPEFFHFYSDGSGYGGTLTLSMGDFVAHYKISPLTGLCCEVSEEEMR